MDVDVESGAWVFSAGDGMGELTGFEWGGVNDHLAGMADVAGILEQPLQSTLEDGYGDAQQQGVTEQAEGPDADLR
jgi:hypothetical protein